MKSIFAIVGETNWGKSNTLDVLFNKKHYTPLNNPITMAGNEQYKFIVIEASNEDRFTDAYLKRLSKVLVKHESKDVIYIITISLMFKSKNHDVKPVFDYLNALQDTSVFYMVLNKSWHGQNLKTDELNQLNQYVGVGRVFKFDEDINRSTFQFKERTKRIREKILSLV